MSSSLDPRSVVLMLLAVIVGLTVQLVLTMRRQPDTRGLEWWSLAAAAGFAGIVLLVARGAISDLLSLWLANVLLISVHPLVWAGVREFDGGRAPRRTLAAMVGAFALVFGAFVAADADLGTRITLVSLCGAAYCVPAVRELLGRRAGASRRYTALLLSALIALFLVRAIAAQIRPPTGEFLAPDPVHTGLLLVQVFLAPLWIVSLLAMVGERAQDRLAEALAEQRRASDAKSDFLRRLAHELRTPLGAVSGFAELIGERSSDPKAREQAHNISLAAEHTIALSDELLDLARIEAGKLVADARPVDAAAAIHETLSILRETFERRRIRVALDTPVPVVLRADPRQLRQMLLNVLGNAAKFGREGGRIDVRVAAAADGAAISVADDGAGIALADPSALFEPFARGEGTSGIEGTGLGLPIVKGFMEAHGGRANIESAPGQGTKVTLHFPPDRVRQAD